jgi:hypothetical protein
MVMKMIMIKKCVAMMLMIMLVVKQVESITPSQEFAPIKLGQPFCEIKCDILCNLHMDFDECVKACERTKCVAWVKPKTLP